MKNSRQLFFFLFWSFLNLRAWKQRQRQEFLVGEAKGRLSKFLGWLIAVACAGFRRWGGGHNLWWFPHWRLFWWPFFSYFLLLCTSILGDRPTLAYLCYPNFRGPFFFFCLFSKTKEIEGPSPRRHPFFCPHGGWCVVKVWMLSVSGVSLQTFSLPRSNP